jgi:hypothetical protein
MTTNHNNEPRDVGYSETFLDYYQDKSDDSWLRKESSSIFAGKNQKDLFIFAMALGKAKNKKATVKSKQSNVSVSAMTEKQKWALLSIGISESRDLICLKDESPLYSIAEKYAEEGMKIIQSHRDRYGINYPKFLEAELRDILGNGK